MVAGFVHLMRLIRELYDPGALIKKGSVTSYFRRLGTEEQMVQTAGVRESQAP